MGKDKKKEKSDKKDGSSLHAAQPASNVNGNANVRDSDQFQSGNGPVEIDDAHSSDDGKDRSKSEHRQGDTVSRDADAAQRLTGKRPADMETESGGNDQSPEPGSSESNTTAIKKSRVDKQLLDDQQYFLGDDSHSQNNSSSSAVTARPVQMMNTMKPMSSLDEKSLQTFRADLIACTRNNVKRVSEQFFTAEFGDNLRFEFGHTYEPHS